jgi:hypothetical protein
MNKDEMNKAMAEIVDIKNTISGLAQELAFSHEVDESDWKIINLLKELVRFKECAIYK